MTGFAVKLGVYGLLGFVADVAFKTGLDYAHKNVVGEEDA